MTVPKFASPEWHATAKYTAKNLRMLANVVFGNDPIGFGMLRVAADLLDPPPDTEAELNGAIAYFASGIASRESNGLLNSDEIDERAEAIRVAARKLGANPDTKANAG